MTLQLSGLLNPILSVFGGLGMGMQEAISDPKIDEKAYLNANPDIKRDKNGREIDVWTSMSRSIDTAVKNRNAAELAVGLIGMHRLLSQKHIDTLSQRDISGVKSENGEVIGGIANEHEGLRGKYLEWYKKGFLLGAVKFAIDIGWSSYVLPIPTLLSLALKPLGLMPPGPSDLLEFDVNFKKYFALDMLMNIPFQHEASLIKRQEKLVKEYNNISTKMKKVEEKIQNIENSATTQTAKDKLKEPLLKQNETYKNTQEEIKKEYKNISETLDKKAKEGVEEFYKNKGNRIQNKINKAKEKLETMPEGDDKQAVKAYMDAQEIKKGKANENVGAKGGRISDDKQLAQQAMVTMYMVGGIDLDTIKEFKGKVESEKKYLEKSLSFIQSAINKAGASAPVTWLKKKINDSEMAKKVLDKTKISKAADWVSTKVNKKLEDKLSDYKTLIELNLAKASIMEQGIEKIESMEKAWTDLSKNIAEIEKRDALHNNILSGKDEDLKKYKERTDELRGECKEKCKNVLEKALDAAGMSEDTKKIAIANVSKLLDEQVPNLLNGYKAGEYGTFNKFASMTDKIYNFPKDHKILIASIIVGAVIGSIIFMPIVAPIALGAASMWFATAVINKINYLNKSINKFDYIKKDVLRSTAAELSMLYGDDFNLDIAAKSLNQLLKDSELSKSLTLESGINNIFNKGKKVADFVKEFGNETRWFYTEEKTQEEKAKERQATKDKNAFKHLLQNNGFKFDGADITKGIYLTGNAEEKREQFVKLYFSIKDLVMDETKGKTAEKTRSHDQVREDLKTLYKDFGKIYAANIVANKSPKQPTHVEKLNAAKLNARNKGKGIITGIA